MENSLSSVSPPRETSCGFQRRVGEALGREIPPGKSRDAGRRIRSQLTDELLIRPSVRSASVFLFSFLLFIVKAAARKLSTGIYLWQYIHGIYHRVQSRQRYFIPSPLRGKINQQRLTERLIITANYCQPLELIGGRKIAFKYCMRKALFQCSRAWRCNPYYRWAH